MTFDAQKFLNARLYPREDAVPVPDLKDYFDEGAEPVWTVRGLTGPELGRANAAAEKSKNLQAIIEGILSPASKEKTEAIRKIAGIAEKETPGDIVKRLEMLKVASVAPECSWEMALKLCENFPIEFYQLTNRITRLTGQGHIPGKPKASGKKGK